MSIAIAAKESRGGRGLPALVILAQWLLAASFMFAMVKALYDVTAYCLEASAMGNSDKVIASSLEELSWHCATSN
eukprot:gene1287-biopygen8264